MTSVELRMSFPSMAALERELEQNLKHGRAFLSEVADAGVLSDCMLVIVHPESGAELRLPAQIVMVSNDGPMRGTGIEVRPFNASVHEQLEEFVRTPPPPAAVCVEETPQTEPIAASGTEAAAEIDTSAILEAMTASAADDAEFDPPTQSDEDLEAEIARDLSDGKSLPPDVQIESKQDKLRHLTAAEQLKVARKGELSDRLVVERLYGKQVWEALLHNPRLTVPEVARIARKGTVPRPLLDVIIENNSWVKTPQVRRALLSNPKVSADAIQKLLRVTPKHELKLIDKGTAYAMPVREAARKLLKQMG